MGCDIFSLYFSFYPKQFIFPLQRPFASSIRPSMDCLRHRPSPPPSQKQGPHPRPTANFPPPTRRLFVLHGSSFPHPPPSSSHPPVLVTAMAAAVWRWSIRRHRKWRTTFPPPILPATSRIFSMHPGGQLVVIIRPANFLQKKVAIVQLICN